MAICKDIEVKVWYSVEDGEPIQVGSATVPIQMEDGETVFDAQSLRDLSEEIISALENT